MLLVNFHILKKLLFFHRREYYRRNTWVIGYNFYKNFIYISPVFWGGIISGFSGVTIFDPWILQFYNPVYEALPCGWYGIYSLEYPQKILVNNPKLYIQGMEGKCFSMLNFMKRIRIYRRFYYLFLGNFWFDREDYFYSVGTAVFAAIIINANLRIVLQTNIYEFYSIIITSLSILSYFLFLFLFSKDYILPGSIVREFLILDNWIVSFLILNFFFMF